MNDFFKLSSVTLANESFVKVKTNMIFSTNTTRKKLHEIFLRNKGIAIEKAEVESTQERIIFFRFSGQID